MVKQVWTEKGKGGKRVREGRKIGEGREGQL